jgi:DnaJ-class molecular chaperone
MHEIFSPDAYDSDLLNDDVPYSYELDSDQSFGSPSPLHDMQDDDANSWSSELDCDAEANDQHFDQDEDLESDHGNSLAEHPHDKEALGAAGSCSLCHGTGSYWSAADRQQVKCARCGGSGIG